MGQIGRLLNSWIVNAKRLFHLLIALAFMFLTLLVGFQAYVEWGEYRNAPGQGLVYVYMYGGFAVFLAILCLFSFAKARSVR